MLLSYFMDRQSESPSLSTFFPRPSNKEKLKYSYFQLYISSTGNTLLHFGLHTLSGTEEAYKNHSHDSPKTTYVTHFNLYQSRHCPPSTESVLSQHPNTVQEISAQTDLPSFRCDIFQDPDYFWSFKTL